MKLRKGTVWPAQLRDLIGKIVHGEILDGSDDDNDDDDDGDDDDGDDATPVDGEAEISELSFHCRCPDCVPSTMTISDDEGWGAANDDVIIERAAVVGTGTVAASPSATAAAVDGTLGTGTVALAPLATAAAVDGTLGTGTLATAAAVDGTLGAGTLA